MFIFMYMYIYMYYMYIYMYMYIYQLMYSLKAVNSYTEAIRLMTLCDISLENPQVIELSLKVGKTLCNKNELSLF